MSLNSLRRISLDVPVIPSGLFEAILTRPTLKQIDFWITFYDSGFEIEQELIKNSMVEEITFGIFGAHFSGVSIFSDLKKF